MFRNLLKLPFQLSADFWEWVADTIEGHEPEEYKLSAEEPEEEVEEA